MFKIQMDLEKAEEPEIKLPTSAGSSKKQEGSKKTSGSDGKASAYNAGDLGSIPGSERIPGEEMATDSSTLAWKIPWTEELGAGHCP